MARIDNCLAVCIVAELIFGFSLSLSGQRCSSLITGGALCPQTRPLATERDYKSRLAHLLQLYGALEDSRPTVSRLGLGLGPLVRANERLELNHSPELASSSTRWPDVVPAKAATKWPANESFGRAN